MKLRAKTALRAASGLATIAIALHASQAMAADDPFALPDTSQQGDSAPDPFALDTDHPAARETAAGDGPMFADVVLNGERLPGVAEMRWIDGELAIEAGFAFSAGIVDTVPQDAFIRIASISGAQYQFDERSFTLHLRVPLRSTGPNLVSLAGRPARTAQIASNITALIVDYDLSAQVDSDGSSFGGLVAPRLVRGNVALESGWSFNSGNGVQTEGFTRLETALTVRSPRHTASATLGDFISQTPAGSRAVRMGGLRIGTDFSVRPDLVTQPLPAFVDTVAVPTGLDVLINDRRIGSAEIEPGEFTVRDIPVPVGRNEVGVVVRDALGRETIRTIDFYGSRDLLAPDLFEAAINIGAIRRRFGRASSDYGPFATSMMVRKGVTTRLTGTWVGEASGDVVNIGTGGDVVIGNLGIFSVLLRASRADHFPGKSKSGSLVALGFESVGPDVSWSIEYRGVSRHYADIASATGDAPPPSLLAANISFDLRDHGRVRFAAVQQHRRPALDPTGPALTTQVISANYRRRLGRSIDLSLDANYRSDPRGGTSLSILAGLSVRFGGSRFAQASVTHGQNQTYVQAGLYDPDIAPGDTGYSLVAGVGVVERFAGSISRQEDWARMEAQAELVGGSAAARMGIRGTLIAADGAVFASQGGGDTYVLVDTGGIADLAIERENRLAGHSRSDGRLLIGQVPGYNTIKVGVDPSELPIDVIAASIEEYVAAAPRSVAGVRLDLVRYIPETFRLADPQGRSFAPGTRIVALPSGSEYLVGFDGIVEINRALGDTEISIAEPDGSTCRADLTQKETGGGDGMPALRCFIRSRVYAIEGARRPPGGDQPDR